jgi:hypothetical protein
MRVDGDPVVGVMLRLRRGRTAAIDLSRQDSPPTPSHPTIPTPRVGGNPESALPHPRSLTLCRI